MEPSNTTPKKEQCPAIPSILLNEQPSCANDKATTTGALSTRENMYTESEPKKSVQEHIKHRKISSIIKWDEQKIIDETRQLYDFQQGNKEKFLQYIEYVHKIGDVDKEILNNIFLTIYKVIQKKIEDRIIEKMQKQGLLKNVIKRRHSFDASFLKEKADKIHTQDQILVKIETCPTNYFDLVRHIYESFKEITQRAAAIEVLCNEMLKSLDPSNSKELSSCSIHNTIFEDLILRNKYIKKAIEDTQKYSIGKKGAQNIDSMIKEMMRSIQNQKVQITVKRKPNIDAEEDKEDDEYDLINEESVSTNYTCVQSSDVPQREPSPLWDKNIDELVSIITCNGKAKKKRGRTTKVDQKNKPKKIDESKENTPENVFSYHLKRGFEDKKQESKHKESKDIRYWQKFLFEPIGSNTDMYNAETEYYIKKFEELARKCNSTAKVYLL